MKKNYFLSLSLFGISAFWAGAVEVPYTSTIADFNTKLLASDWTLENANDDPNTWAVDTDDNKMTEVTGCKIGMKYQYNQYMDADDWLFSPAFSLTAGTEYQVSFWIKEATKDSEKFEIYVGRTAVASDYSDETPIMVYDKNIGTTWRHETVSFTADETGDARIALRVCSEMNQNRLYLRGFSIKDNKKYPAAPDNVMVIPAPDKTLKATISWTLPVTDDEGTPLSKNLSGINVKRNGEKIASLPGNATEYVDETLPEPGIYEYEVSALLDGSEGASAKVTSKWIGIKTAQSLPYSDNFRDPDFFATFWTILDLNNDAKTNSNSTYPPLSNSWCLMTNMMKNAYWPVIYSSRNAQVADDDWLISAPLAFPAKGKYKVSFRLCAYNYGSGVASEYALAVMAGRSDTPEELDIEIGTVETVDKIAMNPNTDGTLFEYEFDVPAPGAYYIGFHSMTPASDIERQLRLGDFKVEVVELAGEEALVPPYRSESDPNWTDKDALTFIAMPGYYHASWQTEGEVSVDSFELDNEFSTDYAVLKVIEESNVVFSSTQTFSAFEILPVDHTPAAAEECSYITLPNGDLEFTIKAPELNISGSFLYEVEGVKIFADDEIFATSTRMAPGETQKLTFDVNPPLPTRADETQQEPVYTVVLHNLSGESEPKIAQKNVESGIRDISSDNAGTKLYLLNGTQLDSDSITAPGFYIEIKNGKARKVIVK